MSSLRVPIEDKLTADQEADLRRAAAAIQLGSGSMAILQDPVLRAFFLKKAVEFYEKFLEAPDSELVAWRNRALDLKALYDTLTAAVTNGQVASERLAQLEEEATRGNQPD